MLKGSLANVSLELARSKIVLVDAEKHYKEYPNTGNEERVNHARFIVGVHHRHQCQLERESE
jgi:hypothetical protein